ncbi:MAG TPA: DUF1592 domain-containing protein [Polyangiaceae bacterium]|nr:DUF1592 domain-containing protein [Polyangiaceae bacterium]
MVVGAGTDRKIWFAAALLLACQGEGPSARSSDQSPAAIQPGPSPIRRLNRFEYNNTVLSLLGDASLPANSFPPEEAGNGFGNDATALGASQILVERFATVAQELASVATSPERLAELAGCEPDGEEEELDCAARFITDFGLRAFRGPLADEERERFIALFEKSRAVRGFAGAIADVVAVMLQSPRFLYRVELDGPTLEDGSVARLSSYEMASRLSYLLLGSMPDDELFELAGRDALQTHESVLAQAQRLLGDPRSHAVVSHFHLSLFGLAGLDALQRSRITYPNFTTELGPLMRRETEAFLEHAVWSGEGTFASLLSADYTFRNARLAEFYGVPGPSGEEFELVSLEAEPRRGFLTQAGPMAALTPGASTNPVIRGVYVRNRLFCDPPPDPPASLMVQEPPPNAAPTARERFASHRTEAACNNCHAFIDPLGLPFENYDGLGQWRDAENDVAIDSSGDLVGTDVEGPVGNAVELVQRIARSKQAHRCYANNWMSYAYGRGFAPEDDAMRTEVEAAFADGGDILELIVALTQTDAFMYRSVEAP